MRGLQVGERAPGDSGVYAGGRSTPWWLVPNLLALDAPVVAVVWLHAFARAFGTTVPWPVTAGLFVAVWSIYLADRLIDARCLREIGCATSRHRFAASYRKEMTALLLLALASGGWLVLTRIDVGLVLAAVSLMLVVLMLVVLLYFGVFVSLVRDGQALPAKEVVRLRAFSRGPPAV